MNNPTTLSICCAALAALSVHTQAPAQTTGDRTMSAKTTTGPYVGAAWGVGFGNREIDDALSSNDEGLGRSTRLFGGYQLSEHFGLQAGYVRLSRLNQNTGAGASLVQQSATGHSSYVAGTGRLPLGPSFALTGKLGVAFGKVSAAQPATAATNLLLGSKTSLLVGTGIDYAFNDKVSLSIELESYGKLSRQVKGHALTLGTRFSF